MGYSSGTNLYEYVSGMPIEGTDAMGLRMPPRPRRGPLSWIGGMLACKKIMQTAQAKTDFIWELIDPLPLPGRETRPACCMSDGDYRLYEYYQAKGFPPTITHQIKHRLLGCFAKNLGAPKLCMEMANLRYEEESKDEEIAWRLKGLEAGVWEFSGRWSFIGELPPSVAADILWQIDTKLDMAEVMVGWSAGGDCLRLIPPECTRYVGLVR
jgi:hypothetical protein